MAGLVEKLSAQRPEIRFVLFDAAVNYERCGCANVHSILFRQNEGAFLAGHLAAKLARDRGGADPAVAIVGGMQIPVIEDYVVGFTAGARHADANIRVLRQYTNSFSDPAAGKEAAKALMGGAAHATVLFTAAGGSGQGVIEAAAEAGRHVIGVDADQYAVYKATHPTRARAIATSVMKNVDVAIEQALRLHAQRKLPYGKKNSLGVAEGGVSLAPHSAVLDGSPALWADVEEVSRTIAAGRLDVRSVWDAQGRLK
jgi:basic membrane protein A and related proteins